MPVGVYPRPSPEARFWANVNLGHGDECWEWLPTAAKNRYGEIYVNGGRITTHRYSWILHNGPIPDDLIICHHCDNPPCVNPGHLYAGTYSDNNSDTVRRGRNTPHSSGLKGVAHGMSNLSETDVLEIRRRYDAGEGLGTISDDFNITRTHACRIGLRKCWKHL